MCVDAAKKAVILCMVCLPSAYTAVVLYVIDSPLYTVDSTAICHGSEC